MKSPLFFYVVNGKLKTVLIAEDSLMLGSVILEGTSYVLHKSYK